MDDSHERYFILDKVAELKPATILDVGCGCGEMTVRLAPLCVQVTAVDLFDGLIERCRNERPRPNITYLPMDARALTFPDGAFGAVIERDSLHHMDRWQEAVRQMVRVAAQYVLIEEPFDDFRTEAKRTAAIVQDLMLEVQHEADYPHFRHIPLDDVLGSLSDAPLDVTHEIFRRDDLVTWEHYEEPFRFFAAKTVRESYWLDRFASLKRELAGRPLGKADKVLVVGTGRLM